MAKMNCWERKKCGREQGGVRASVMGVCPASVEVKIHGVNNGKNGGRSCWAVSGTFSGGTIQGTFAQKIFNCMDCDFYKNVVSQEAGAFVPLKEIITVLRSV